ncbi:MAG: response regulator transcription factor [Butyrivibrio sp.]|nr:response regulator transcription factor [Butyrivibrio sp.]
MKVIVVDDDAIVATSMNTILSTDPEIDVVAIGYDGTDAVRLYEEYKPDILLTDIQMQTMSGLDAATQIIAKYPDAKIILLTTFMDDEYVRQALDTGAKGYILKQDFAGVLPAIRAVFSGQSVFGSKIIDRIPSLISQKDMSVYEQHGITDKEYEIIELVAEGLSNKEIAAKLYLSEGTVRNYISLVLEKLELRDRTQLAVFFYKH